MLGTYLWEMEASDPTVSSLLADIKKGALLPNQTIDCTILAYAAPTVYVLLLKWKGEDIWGLPGGFVRKSENFDQAATRILQERTGLSKVYLKQFQTFSELGRNRPADEVQQAVFERVANLISSSEVDLLKQWLDQRFITTGYFALIDRKAAQPKPDFLSDACAWIPIADMPKLMLDHQKIFNSALHNLRTHINYLPIGRTLLPPKFTMRELQSLYEGILQKPLVRSNFQRKMLSLKILSRHDKLMTGAANKAPYLYSFDAPNYQRLLIEGIGF